MTDSGTPQPEPESSPPDGTAVDGIAAANEVVSDVRRNVERVIVGNTETIDHVLTAILARGHVLLEDVPGVGKTMLARALAQSVDGEFNRIQFTPDLLPTDVTGTTVYNQKRETFEFRAGPVFANIVLGDEINRAPPKTQSALLEAMEENQVTVDGETRALPEPFTVIATQNAVESDHGYELPIAERDRFMKKLRLGYPDPTDEIEMLSRIVGEHPIETLGPVVSLEELQYARSVTAGLSIVEPIRVYATELATFTRDRARIGLSPRGTLQLLRAAQARAVLEGREYVIPDDIKREAPVVIPHRIHAGADQSALGLVEEALDTIDPE